MLEDDDLTAATDLYMTDDEFENDYGDSEALQQMLQKNTLLSTLLMLSMPRPILRV